MSSILTFSDTPALARAAATAAVEHLQQTLAQQPTATWVLAGGSTPLAAYEMIARDFTNALDWSKVTFVIGDERIGALDSKDNNCQAIIDTLLVHFPQYTLLRPKSDLSAEHAAADYAVQLATLPTDQHGRTQFDLVWLGMGEDGHTLSLFPDHADFSSDDTRLVIPVHNSPKPPSNRISLTLHALAGARHTAILTAGASKRTALTQALQPDSHLPIAQAARITSATWYCDEAALN